jgi:hypothetical protein
MKFEVIKPFTWSGQDLKAGDEVDIPDESTKIGPLARAKFIRPKGILPISVPKSPPQAEEVVDEIKAEEQNEPEAKGDEPKEPSSRDPKEIVKQAKAKADAKKPANP